MKVNVNNIYIFSSHPCHYYSFTMLILEIIANYQARTTPFPIFFGWWEFN